MALFHSFLLLHSIPLYICTSFKKILEYSCFAMLLVSTVQQGESAIYIHIYPLFFQFPSYLGHHRAFSRVPELYSRFSLVIYFIHSIIVAYMSIPIFQFIPPPLSPLVSIHLFSASVSLPLFLLCK